MKKIGINRATNIIHMFLRNKISEGDVVIDATLGNGYDTLFLLKQIGDRGSLYAFDIQEKAIEATKQLLINENISLASNNINLILDGHEHMGKYIQVPVDVVMFNLGYLPGSNKKIITKAETTLRALETSLRLLKSGGIATLIIYCGHKGGLEEKKEILNYVKRLEVSEYTVLYCDYINHQSNPPKMLIIERK